MIAAVANDLAQSLRFDKRDSLAFTEQFSAVATCPSVARVAGDGATYRQALCFPLAGAVKDTDTLKPYPGLPPHLVIEFSTGQLFAFRLDSTTQSKLSVSAFLTSIERYLDILKRRESFSWHSIQSMIEGAHRQRIKLFDFMLDDAPDPFWQDYFPQGAVRLAKVALQGLSTTDAMRKKVAAALLGMHADHYRRTCAEFIADLDNERIRAIRASCLAPKISIYNQFQETNANSLFRIQAAESLPLLAYLLGSNGNRTARLRRLVDDGQPLWPALADLLRVPEETIRWLRNKTAETVGDAWLGRIHELLPDLAKLPPEKRPKTAQDWTAYTDFILVLTHWRVAQHKDTWLADLARIGWEKAWQKFADMNATPSDLLEIGDFVSTLARAIYQDLLPENEALPQARQNAAWDQVSAAIDEAFFGVSILKQVRASLRWHELLLQPAETEVDDASPDSRELSSWPAPFTEPRKMGSLYARFLTSPGQLTDEGMRMQHCVGSYDYACLFGGANIVSFRDDAGRSVSTAELHLKDRSNQLRMVVHQHKGPQNSEPTPAARQALDQLLTHLQDDDMQDKLQEMQIKLVQRQARDEQGKRWNYMAPNAPERVRILRAALKLHIGYGRMLEIARKAIDA